MVQSLTLPAGTCFSFSVQSPLSPTAHLRSNRRVSFHRINARRAPINAAAVAEAPLTEVRRRPPSLYKVLRVEENASAKEIKAAYRNLAKLYHPDAAEESSDGRYFIEIHDAYSTLSDPVSRALYDVKLNAGLRRCSAGSEYYPTRRWETDQCW